jgi:hypothetical protein
MIQGVNRHTVQTATVGIGAGATVLAVAALAGRHFRGEWGALLTRAAPTAAFSALGAAAITWRRGRPAYNPLADRLKLMAPPLESTATVALPKSSPWLDEKQPNYVDPSSGFLLLANGSTAEQPDTEELDLSYNLLINDDNVLAVVQRFPNLKKLHLRSCPNLTDAGVDRLPTDLQELDLRDNLQLRKQRPGALLDRTLVVGGKREEFLESYLKFVSGMTGGGHRENVQRAFAQYRATNSFYAGNLAWQELKQLYALGREYPQLQRLCADKLQMRLEPGNVADLHQFAQENELRALRLSCQTYAFHFGSGGITVPLALGPAEYGDFKLTGVDQPLQRRKLAALFPFFRTLFNPYDERGAYVQDELEIADGEAIQTIAEQWDLPAEEAVELVDSLPQAMASLIADAEGVDQPPQPKLLLNKLFLANLYGRPDLEERYANEYGQQIVHDMGAEALQRAIASGQPVLIQQVSHIIRSQLQVSSYDELKTMLFAAVESNLDQDFVLDLADAVFDETLAYAERNPEEIFLGLYTHGLASTNGLRAELDNLLFPKVQGALDNLSPNWKTIPSHLLRDFKETRRVVNAAS